jgi:hypothetical protein
MRLTTITRITAAMARHWFSLSLAAVPPLVEIPQCCSSIFPTWVGCSGTVVGLGLLGVGVVVVVVDAGVGDELVGGDRVVAGAASVFDVPACGEQPERCGGELADDGVVDDHGCAVIVLRAASARARWARRR